jgi:hypothetical protein
MNKSFDAKTLILVFDNGVDKNGNPAYTRKSIKNIREEVTEAVLYDVGLALAKLFDKVILNVCVDEDYVLLAV